MPVSRTLELRASHLVLACALSGFVLSGCQQNNAPAAAVNAAPAPLAALPLATDGAPAITRAPPASALPAAPPARIGRLANASDEYAYADRAYAMSQAFGDAPPDYTFDYGGGERPWVWRADNNSMRVAEPLPGGGERYYYYEPGAQTPYLVQDPDYSYGYDNGVLVVVYDRGGRTLPPDEAARRADVAGRFLARALAIYQASQAEQRQAVAEANWEARREAINAGRAQWASDQAANTDWRDYHAQHQTQDQTDWSAEEYRRRAEAARFDEATNDQQAAQKDWEAAGRAQTRAVAAGQLPPPAGGHAGLIGSGPPPAAPASPPPPPPPHSNETPAGQPAASLPGAPAHPPSGAGGDHDHGRFVPTGQATTPPAPPQAVSVKPPPKPPLPPSGLARNPAGPPLAGKPVGVGAQVSTTETRHTQVQTGAGGPPAHVGPPIQGSTLAGPPAGPPPPKARLLAGPPLKPRSPPPPPTAAVAPAGGPPKVVQTQTQTHTHTQSVVVAGAVHPPPKPPAAKAPVTSPPGAAPLLGIRRHAPPPPPANTASADHH